MPEAHSPGSPSVAQPRCKPRFACTPKVGEAAGSRLNRGPFRRCWVPSRFLFWNWRTRRYPRVDRAAAGRLRGHRATAAWGGGSKRLRQSAGGGIASGPRRSGVYTSTGRDRGRSPHQADLRRPLGSLSEFPPPAGGPWKGLTNAGSLRGSSFLKFQTHGRGCLWVPPRAAGSEN